MQKGTAAINAAWLRHPEWPRLTIYWHEPNARVNTAPNIEWVKSIVTDQELQRAQNAHGIHLCPSEAEGLGHYLLEAMACKALVVSTDAPPMNELVAADRGILARYDRAAPQGAGTNFYVDPDDLELKVAGILAVDDAHRRVLGERARAWYLANDRETPHRMKEIFEKIC
jgi:glycosyltransferase involved in cell wall biosynthesis